VQKSGPRLGKRPAPVPPAGPQTAPPAQPSFNLDKIFGG
jgi:hypothetical protein